MKCGDMISYRNIHFEVPRATNINICPVKSCRDTLSTFSVLISFHRPSLFQVNLWFKILRKTIMATISAATAPTSSVNRPSLVRIQRSARVSSSSVLGLPVAVKKGRVRCSIEEKASSPLAKAGMGAWLISTAAAAAWSPAAMALVDERLSTEGTGLSFGLSNNLLGWILLGIFGLIWTLYFGYTSTLEEDEESGLSL